jgi:hypothetical protein
MGEISVPVLRRNSPDERRASLGEQDCVEFARRERPGRPSGVATPLGIKRIRHYEYATSGHYRFALLSAAGVFDR